VICPPQTRLEIRQTIALDRLQKAAQALLSENTEVAQASYKEPTEPWSDAMWRRADPGNAKLCIELRRALAEMAACAKAST
jgi:hypothetical protein